MVENLSWNPFIGLKGVTFPSFETRQEISNLDLSLRLVYLEACKTCFISNSSLDSDSRYKYTWKMSIQYTVLGFEATTLRKSDFSITTRPGLPLNPFVWIEAIKVETFAKVTLKSDKQPSLFSCVPCNPEDSPRHDQRLCLEPRWPRLGVQSGRLTWWPPWGSRR